MKTAREIMLDQIFDQQREIAHLRGDQYTDTRKAQGRLDPVFRAFGDTLIEGTMTPIVRGSAPAPLDGEGPTGYTRRVLEDELKRFSPQWEGTDIKKLPEAILPIAERQIIADAYAEAAKPTTRSLPADGTIAVKIRQDATGVARFRERHSVHSGAVWDRFKSRNRFVVAFKNQRTGEVQQAIPESVLTKVR